MSSKVHSTEMKTISDKYGCNPHAFLLRPACKTESFRCSVHDTKDFGDIKMKHGKEVQQVNQLLKQRVIYGGQKKSLCKISIKSMALSVINLLWIIFVKLLQAHETVCLGRGV